jgi:glycosyltransferase involved in cell wall biosynthesis
MMKVVFFSRSYENMAGGIEKMSLLLARGLVDRGHSVLIISIDNQNACSFYPWPKGVGWLKLEIGNPHEKASTRQRLKRIRAIRSAIKRENADVVVGFQVGSFALIRLSTLFLSVRAIAAERNSPKLFEFIGKGLYKRFFSNLILSTADVITIQFGNYQNYYPRILHGKLRVTPNPVIPVKINPAHSFSSAQKFRLLFIGRLTFQKNVEVLITALNLLPRNISLVVVGDGPDLSRLQTLVKDFSVDVTFLSPTQDLSSQFLQSHIFVLPSRWEGFPNVVAESLSHGLPVVGFEKCSGVPELISTGVNGWVSEGEMSAENLSVAIASALATDFDRKVVSETVAQYTFENFVGCWENALNGDIKSQ